MTPEARQRAARVCAAAAVLLLAHPSAAQQPRLASRSGEGPHVRVELIADRAGLGPGMRLGLKFDLDPEWHVYWQNPGDSGGPPEVAWTLPPGMTAAGIEWPAPERIDVGGLVNYGYHNAVLLPVMIGAAAGARIPDAFTVRGSVRWLACANVCISGRADLALGFPLNADESRSVAGWSAAIAASRRRVPNPAPASWRASARSAEDRFVVEVTTGSREHEAVFFPLEPSQVDDSAAQVVTPLPDGVRLALRKSNQLVTDPQLLRGVLSVSGGRAYVIEAPFRQN